jgi:cell division FtsZ-interacting protein ZapD
VITYEYPLVERIRTMLRLEDLFERGEDFAAARPAPLVFHAQDETVHVYPLQCLRMPSMP